MVENLRAENPDARIIMLTGYGNIATAVEAVKRGAVDYLPNRLMLMKFTPLVADDGARALPPENPMSADRVRGSIFSACLIMRPQCSNGAPFEHARRTLQRILASAPRWPLARFSINRDQRKPPIRAMRRIKRWRRAAGSCLAVIAHNFSAIISAITDRRLQAKHRSENRAPRR